jgi:hypothetical protein
VDELDSFFSSVFHHFLFHCDLLFTASNLLTLPATFAENLAIPVFAIFYTFLFSVRQYYASSGNRTSISILLVNFFSDAHCVLHDRPSAAFLTIDDLHSYRSVCHCEYIQNEQR